MKEFIMSVVVLCLIISIFGTFGFWERVLGETGDLVLAGITMVVATTMMILALRLS